MNLSAKLAFPEKKKAGVIRIQEEPCCEMPG